MSSWKVILATLIIFGAGVITGGLLVSYAVHANRARPNPKALPLAQTGNPWQQRARELLRRMDRELNLTPEQHQHIEKSIAESSERTRALWRPIAPQMNREMQKLHREIRDELNPEQQKKFDEISPPRQERRRLTTNSPAAATGTNSLATNGLPETP